MEINKIIQNWGKIMKICVHKWNLANSKSPITLPTEYLSQAPQDKEVPYAER